MFLSVLSTIVVGLQLVPAAFAQNIVQQLCSAECDGSIMENYNKIFQGDVKAYIVPNNTCYDETAEILSDGGRYTFFKDGKEAFEIIFKISAEDGCYKGEGGANPVLVKLDECKEDELALGFTCATETSAANGFVMSKKGHTVSQACADATLKQLKELGYTPKDRDVYKCLNVKRTNLLFDLVRLILDFLAKLL